MPSERIPASSLHCLATWVYEGYFRIKCDKGKGRVAYGTDISKAWTVRSAQAMGLCS